MSKVNISKKKVLGPTVNKKQLLERKVEKPVHKSTSFFIVNQEKIRFGIVYFSVIFLFGYLLYSLFNLQVKKAQQYIQIKNEQHSSVQGDDSNRGKIFATRKDGVLVPLAIMSESYKLAISPRDIPESYRDRVFTSLNQIVTLDKETFYQKVAKRDDPYEELQEIDKDKVEKIESLNLVGVQINPFKKRSYPLGEVGAKVIGFVGNGEGGNIGRAGLEKYYNDLLSSQNVKVVNFFSAVFAELNQERVSKPMVGQNLVTTLEPNVMIYLHQLLQDIQTTWKPDTVGAIIMNPKTGEIIAMDGLPSFDPNDYRKSEAKSFINPNVQGVYELGSIFKPLTMSLGIENRLITPDSYFHDTGFVELDGYTIKNFDGKARGDVTMQTVLGQSLNTGVVYLMKLLGKDRFRDGLIKFGIEEETGIDLPGEISNQTSGIHSAQLVNYATIAFGQGVALTPIAMLRALSSIVNDGQLVTPYVVSKKINSDGEEVSMAPHDLAESVSKETANTVRNMLIHNIDKDYANGKYKDNNYAVGAKTGTAQLTKEFGGYFDDRFLHSYFMFLGSGDQQFTIIIFQVNPKQSVLASTTLTPFADKLKQFLITYYSLKPDRQL